VRAAAVDLGTNSLRLLVADLAPGRPAVDVLRRLAIVRLGEGVDADRVVTSAALDRVAAVLDGYTDDVRRLGVERVRAVATSATRDAANRDEVVRVVRRHLGVEPDVLTGEQEAALTFTGAVSGLPPGAPEPVLVVDVGGGSTELALGRGGRLVAWASLDVGSVRQTERHLRPHGAGNPRPGERVAAVQADVDAAIDAAGLPLAGVGTVLAVAGTATAVAALAVEAPTHDDVAMDGVRLDRRRLDEVVAWLVASTRAERAAHRAVHPGRVEVLPAGALVLQSVLGHVPRAEVVVGVRDLLDGAAASLLALPPVEDEPPRQDQ
jgi:exopolyphosphatase/guanosine-5'-triphosphate,3'-diphosphate pyrophosphatase